jgi:hypothetical protein
MKRIVFFKKLSCSLVFIFCLGIIIKAQNSTDAAKTDSIYKANQLKAQNDSLAKAQQSALIKHADTRPMSQRIGFDLNTSFWINVSRTFFEISPVIEYRLPKTYSIGFGPTYIYNHDRIRQINLNGWGGKVYAKAGFTNWLYAYTEYQGISNQYISGIDPVTNKAIKSNSYVDSWFLSLGMSIRAGKRHGINLQALYDLLYDQVKSPYYGAWTYRIGFGF